VSGRLSAYPACIALHPDVNLPFADTSSKSKRLCQACIVRGYSTSSPKQDNGKYPEYPYDNRISSTNSKPQPLESFKSTGSKRPSRPLSFTELLNRQKAEHLRQQKLEQAKREYEEQRQTVYAFPDTPGSVRTSSFRPQRGTRRFLRTVYRDKLGLDDKSYPFPENQTSVKSLKKKKEIYFPTAHRFITAKYRDIRHQRLLETEKAPKKLQSLAKRTAWTIVKKRYIEGKQIDFEKDKMLEWKENDETVVLPVTTEDITHDDGATVTFRDFSETWASIRLAAKLLQEDSVIGFPTETVYGLGANALSTSAVEKIYKAKNRPADNPLITHFGSIEQLRSFTDLPDVYLPLVKKFWPGPLTILLPVTEKMGISSLVTAGLDTVAVRIPSSAIARALILEANVPIAAPSANASTRPSPTLAEHVRTDLNGRIPLILSADGDAGSQCDVGLESTVVDGLSSPPTILRLGGVSPEAIRAVGGIWRDITIYQKPVTDSSNGAISEVEFKPRTPGMKYRHYSPRCPVYVYSFGTAQPESPSELLPPSDVQDRKVAVLCTGSWEPKADSGAEIEFNWLGDDNEEIARNLFKCVRDMDEWGAEAILVEGVEETGIGRSVMERLKKMAGGVIKGQEDT
jgi:L-threonylcarbamoyladenylate synthase